jgi:hypothetical protein
MNGLATRNKLHAVNHHRDDVINGPDNFGLPKPPQDPHDVEARKWFRATLIALVVAGFAIIFMPDGIRKKLNAWAGTPTAEQTAHYGGMDKRTCTNDWHERCLVCEHHLATGEYVRSAHC